MSDDLRTELEAMRERAEAATEGPWTADGLEGNLDSPRGRVAEATWWREVDAQFIAHARTDVPRLVAALEAVLLVHQPDEDMDCTADGDPWPCHTARVITAALTDTKGEPR